MPFSYSAENNGPQFSRYDPNDLSMGRLSFEVNQKKPVIRLVVLWEIVMQRQNKLSNILRNSIEINLFHAI